MVDSIHQFKKIVLGIFVGLAFFALALGAFSQPQAILVGLIAFLVTLWTNEGLPLGVVSLLPMVLFPAFDLLGVKATTANYSHPIIYLFLGGGFYSQLV